MATRTVLIFAAVALSSVGITLAAPYDLPNTQNLQCPLTVTETTTYTGLVIAPSTTYPYTSTAILTYVDYPMATSTSIETYSYSGTVDVGTPATTPVETDFTTTITNLYTYTNWFQRPPWPTDC